MSTYDPIDLGEHAQHSYAQYLIGTNQRGYQGLLNTFTYEDEETAEQAFIRSKGPYLQGVPSARWSNTSWREFAQNEVDGEFAPNGLEEALISAFEAQSFTNLQKHQEDAIRELVQDKHALIAAGTGRGKTEAWFIPILQYALRAKQGKVDGVNPESIKAVLTYPTKALAQDQLKRFIEYLWIVNRNSTLPEDRYLTIGVYDGDTPRRGQRKDGKDTHKYLEDSFEFFELPDTIAEELADSQGVLDTVPPNLHVKKDGEEYFLQSRGAYGNERIKFVHLTRDKIENSPPDILLTNPDTINYRLFNINDERSHQLFIDQPKFLVFDEVHTYEGLFGAHVSMLVKRLRQLREARDVDIPLRLIASSATVGHKEELFQRLFGVPHGDPYEIIEEDIDIADPDRLPPDVLPSFLLDQHLDTETLEAELETWYEGGSPSEYDWIDDLGITPADCRGAKAAIEQAASAGTLTCLDHLHQVLQDPTHDEYDIAEAPRPADFVEYLERTYTAIEDTETAERVAQNVLSLFEVGGYEVRVHVFNWPVDGYYKCIHCHTIYAKPQSCDCGGEEGHSSFVTKIRLCKRCGEQVYEAWYCPDCGDVRPVTQETEGEYLYANKPECSHPNHGDLVRVYWTPDYECEDCGASVQPSESLGSCETCSGVLTRTEDGIVCKNPECNATYESADTACAQCGGMLEPQEDIDYECTDPDCDLHGVSQGGLECESCDAPLIPKLVLPWVCSSEEHGRTYSPDNLPDQCGCGRRTFVLPSYIDTQEADYCTECNVDRTDVFYLPGSGCAIHDESAVERVQKSFGLKIAYRDGEGNIRLDSRGKAKHAVPCYHRHPNYDHLMRSPVNTGVTMSQFMLRKLADEGGDQSHAKLMSFADSYSDMEKLANDFDEPERLLFIQQQMLSYLAENRETRLEELINETASRAREYWNDLGAPDDIIDKVIGYREWRGTITGELIEGSYRVFRGDYERRYGGLVSRGMLNIAFKKSPSTPDQRKVCEGLLEGNRVLQERLMGTLRDKRNVENPTGAIGELKDEGIIRVDQNTDRVELDANNILVRTVGDGNPIHYLHTVDTFISDAAATARDKKYENAKDFEIPYTERATLESPYFDRDAYWAATTAPRMLLSKVYKGDLPADERRRLEHEFKRNATPNFLSTGPAMEIGIDIGDLNTLLLMGTPPNTNAYLQRIGRAGRSEGKSLVTTISKRNPIDFYYHKKPDQIIKSSEKPIPLDQHNEHVLQNALTWAIVDYISISYHIPWEQIDEIEGKKIKRPMPDNWDQYKKDEPISMPPASYKRFTQVYYSNVEEAYHGEPLLVLEAIATQDDGVRAWLEELLEYAYCRNCGHIYDAAVSGICTNCDVDQELRVAKEEYRDIIDDVIEHFGTRLIRFANFYRQSLQDEQGELEKRRSELSEVIRDDQQSSGFGDFTSGEDDTSDDVAEAKRKISRVRKQIKTIDQLIEEYQGSSLAAIHERSAESKFVPQLRAFGDSVAVTRHQRDPQSGEIVTTQESSWDRNASMALREFHPGAYNLKNKRGYVVTRIHEDTEGTKELADTIGTQLRCLHCGYETEWAGQRECPNCGRSDHKVNRVEPIAIKRVELSDKERMIDETQVTDIYPLTDYHTSPRNTFAHVETTISEFEPDQQITLPIDSSRSLTIEHGDIGITEAVDSFTTTYSDGRQDPSPQTLTICRENYCNSVVTKNTDGDRVCLRDRNHDTGKQSEVMIGRSFTTKGIRLKSRDLTPKVIHTLTHGFRLALQRTGGVEVRSLQESYDKDAQEAHIFESTIGGNGVTNLLFNREDGQFVELIEALQVMGENIEGCDCTTGCPECIYQYGCDEGNDQRTFDKQQVVEEINRIRIRTEETEVIADD